MICNLCKHEWCWFCNEDAPIHTSECPFYPEYLKIIQFVDEAHSWDNFLIQHPSWFFQRRQENACHWFCTLLLVILFLPLIIIANVLITPYYMTCIIENTCLRFWNRQKKCLKCILVCTFFFVLYIFVPYTFLVITVPQIVVIITKKVRELFNLCKNKCRKYNRLDPKPVLLRHYIRIRLN